MSAAQLAPLACPEATDEPHESQDPGRSLSDSERASFVWRMAILGNVSVGKTSLFDRLRKNGEHAVNIPGSTQTATHGVLAVGPGAAPRAFRRHCGSCGGSLKPKSSCSGSSTEASLVGCPAVGRRTRGLEIRSAEPASDPAFRDQVARELSSKRKVIHLFDTPGSTTLAANGEDEMVARDLLLSGLMDGVLLVADAKNLRRSIAFALEVAELGLPMVFDLNMLDEAECMGIEIDDVELARSLGVPVNRTIAVENVGVRRLSELLLEAQIPSPRVRFPASIEAALSRLGELLANPVLEPRALGLLLLTEDRGAQAWVAGRLGEQILEKAQALVEEAKKACRVPIRVVITDCFHTEAGRVVDRAVFAQSRSPSLLSRFGHLAGRPLPGAMIGLLVLIAAYYWVGVFGATFVVDNLATHVFDGFLVPLFQRLVDPIPSAFVRDAIMDPDFGLLPTGVFLAVGVVLPVLFCFYLLQAVLEDSGYLPRLAVLFDRILRRVGLNGQGLIPLVLGFSCITMAVITTRMVPTRKERFILTLLLVLGIPCAPLLAVMMVILGKMPWTASVAVVGVLASQIFLAGYLANKLISGRLSDLILEIPQMRLPRPKILLVKTWRRTWQFMQEALPVFLVAAFVVFVFDRIGGLTVLENSARPLVHGLLGLPDQAVHVFVKTAIRRESGAAELALLAGQFDNVQLVVTMLVMTFLMPCINAAIVIVKERGLKAAISILTMVAVWALTVGTVVNLFCRSLNITFS